MKIRLPILRACTPIVIFGFCILSFVGSIGNAGPAARKIQLPREIDLYRPGQGVEAANTYCLACHSADYAAIQPRMPSAFWQTSVKKMREKYGAEIPEPVAGLLVNYLATTYGADQNSAAVATPLTAGPGPQTGGSKSPVPLEKSGGTELVARYGCVLCHGADKRIVGPGFNAVAAKYRSDTGAAAKVLRQIQQGGGGQWGSIPMPPYPQISAEDANAIARWILALK